MVDKIRFRTMATPNGEIVVLQVCLYEEDRYGYTTPKLTWRDAKVEDLLDVGAIINSTNCPTTLQVGQ